MSQRQSRGLVTGCQALVMTTSLLSSQPRSTSIAPFSQQPCVCINRGVACERRDLHGVNLCNIVVTRFPTPTKRQQKLAFKTIKRLRKNADVVHMRSKRIRTRSTVGFKCVTEAILIRLLQAHRSYFVNNLNEKSHVLTKSPFSGQIRDLLG